MRVLVLCVFVCLLSVFPVFAIPVTFDFSITSTTNQYWDVLVASELGVDLSVFSEVQGAQVTQKSGGLGVSFDGDNSTTLDGSVGFDSLTFKFSQMVTLLGVRFSYYESGDQFSLFTADYNLTMDIPVADGEVALSLMSDSFVFGVTDANDDYRIEALSVDFAPIPTPEPSTWLMLSSGLASLFILRRRSG